MTNRYDPSLAPTRHEIAAWIIAGAVLLLLLPLHLISALLAGLLVHQLTHLLVPFIRRHITDERAKSATFSQPYFDSTLALLVGADSGINSAEDLQGKQVAVQTDTTGQAWADENAGKYGFTSRVFDDMPTASNSVLGGVTAATVNDNGVLFDFAKDNPTTKVVQEFETGEQYGFNVGNDNKALAEKIDEVLDAARADGRFNDIYKKWFGVDAPTK